MEITFLGTSSAVHSHNRNHPGIILKAFGEVMLFDCGESCQKQLIYTNISPMKISKIFISHYHGDHILGLPGLLQSLNFLGREKPLTIYGPKGIKKIEYGISLLGFSKLNFPVEFVEIESGTIIENEEYIIKSQQVKHNIINLAYSIEEKKKPRFLRQKAINLGVPVGPAFGRLHNGEEIEIDGRIIKPSQVLGEPRKGKKITYSGDTLPCDEMIEFAKDSDLLIHESTYMLEDNDKAKENFHSTSQDAATIAKYSNSKKLILTHISSRYTNITQLLNESKEIFKNVEVANDLMTIEI